MCLYLAEIDAQVSRSKLFVSDRKSQVCIIIGLELPPCVSLLLSWRPKYVVADPASTYETRTSVLSNDTFVYIY